MYFIPPFPRVNARLAQAILVVLLASAPPAVAVGARIDSVWIECSVMHRALPVLVVIPHAPRDSIQRFPVVYMLHGFGGNYRAWMDAIDLADLADRSHCVLVCPDGSRNSWYLDSPIDTLSQYETFVVQDVVPWVNRHLPVDSSRDCRAITGISMGGHGSLYLAIRHHELFIAAGTMSGVLDLWDTTQPRELSRRLGTTEEYPDRWDGYSVLNMVDSLRGVDIDIVIDCGVDDPFIDNNRAMHERLLDLGIPHDYSERPGGHTWLFWKRSLEYQMQFFGESFRRRCGG